MSWYDEDWKYRMPLSVVNTAGAGTIDISAPFPRDHDLFWNNVRADGFDIRVTEADGITPISLASGNATAWDFGAAPFSVATKTFVLRIDGWTGPVATVNAALQLFLYFGNPTAADTRDGVVALVGALTGIFATRNPSAFPLRTVTGRERFGSDHPTFAFQRTPTDITEIAWDFGKEMARRDTPSEAHMDLEELKAIEVGGGQGNATVAAIFDASKTRFLKKNVVITHHIAGINGQSYWLEAKATTTLGQRFTRRIQMRVKNTVQIS